MAAQFLTLEVGNLVIPAGAMGNLRVQYEDQAARTDRRTASGAFNRRTAWSGKLRATITADSFAPLGLDTLDQDTAYTVALPVQRSVSSASNVITLPAARRSGGLYDPVGFAVVDGQLVSTQVAVVTNTATCTVVSGASGYRVDYYPSISAYLTVPDTSLDGARATHAWQIVVEEA